MIIAKIPQARFLISSNVSVLTYLLPPSSYAQDEAIAYSGITESRMMFQDYCAVCHGENLEGSAQGSPLRGNLTHGESMNAIITSITNGFDTAGMPSWRDIFAPVEIQGLAMYVLESRANVGYVTSNYDAPMVVPKEEFETSLHNFRIETLVTELDLSLIHI